MRAPYDHYALSAPWLTKLKSENDEFLELSSDAEANDNEDSDCARDMTRSEVASA